MTAIDELLDELDRNDDTTPKRHTLSNVLIALIVFAGVLVASYPSIAQWVTAMQRADMVTGYSESLERVGPEVLEDVLEEARRYNDNMPGVLVSDPYSLDDARTGQDGAWERYLDALNLPDTDIMATVRIPSINVDLPIRHGTDDATLAAGAGHLFGSSLPVGGENTHSVITAHTELASAHLFDDLDKVEVGEVFYLDVAGETLAYQVDSIDTVLPHEVESLQLEPGRDLVTLVTCAPPTVNTHRLLVTGERVDLPEQELAGEQDNRVNTSAGFPWWMLWVGASGVAITVVTMRLNKRGSTTGDEADEQDADS